MSKSDTVYPFQTFCERQYRLINNDSDLAITELLDDDSRNYAYSTLKELFVALHTTEQFTETDCESIPKLRKLIQVITAHIPRWSQITDIANRKWAQHISTYYNVLLEMIEEELRKSVCNYVKNKNCHWDVEVDQGDPLQFT